MAAADPLSRVFSALADPTRRDIVARLTLVDATGALHGMRLQTLTPAHLARAAVEGLLCGLADAVDALVAQGIEVSRVLLVGGGARSEAVRTIAPALLGRPVLVPPPGEYVADGAARQAAWALRTAEAGGAGDGEGDEQGGPGAPPSWDLPGVERFEGDPVPAVRERYAEVRDLTARRPADAPAEA